MPTPLADAFLAAAPEGASTDCARLERRLADLGARVTEATREFALDAEVLATGLARSTALREALLGESEPSVGDEALDEVVLATAARGGDARAVARLDRRYVEPLGPALAHLRLDAGALDEVKQRVRIKLLAADERGAIRLEQYAGTGRLQSLVRVAATREALDLVRRPAPDAPGDPSDLLELPGAARDPALDALARRFRAEFRAAFERSVRALESRERNLLRLHLLGGVTLEQLAEMYRVHRATVVRWLAEARRKVLTGTRKALGARMHVAADELESLMRLAESGLDVSVERLLRSQSAGERSDDGDPGAEP